MNEDWPELEIKLFKRFGKTPDLQGILFLIGVNTLSQGSRDFAKEEKQDLIHVGICEVLCHSGFYEFVGRDAEGWPHYKELKTLQKMPLKDQEEVLKFHILEYFKDQDFISQK